VANSTVGVDRRFKDHDPFFSRANRDLRVIGVHTMQQCWPFDIAADANRLHRRWRRWRRRRWRSRHHEDAAGYATGDAANNAALNTSGDKVALW
jgi:hypothetical protein